jgi:hypothetical protein
MLADDIRTVQSDWVRVLLGGCQVAPAAAATTHSQPEACCWPCFCACTVACYSALRGVLAVKGCAKGLQRMV